MPISKVTYCGQTLVDLLSDTVTAGSMISGYTAHGADGSALTGSLNIWNLTWGDLSDNQYNNTVISLMTTQSIVTNKVIYCGSTLIDLSSDTIIADALLAGYLAHSKNGQRISGRLQLASVTWSDLENIL